MKKLLLLLVAGVLCIGNQVKAADVVESFETFSEAKQTWLPTTASATAKEYTSSTTDLVWTVSNVNAAKNTGKIYMTFKKDVKSYMEADPGIVCKQVEINVGFAGANGGMTLYVGDTQIAHKDVTSAGDFVFDVPITYQVQGTRFKLVNTQKTGASKGNQMSVYKITFKEADNSGTTLAVPVFSVPEGWVLADKEVELSCATADAVIYYTTDGTEPTSGSTPYTAPIVVDKDMTIKAVACKDGESSAVATADYKVYPANSAEAPLSVSQALSLIDAGFPVDVEVYVAGTVSEVKEMNTQYKNATYTIKDEADNELLVYRGKYLDGADFTSQDQIAVGDKVVVRGKIKNYNGTKEFDANNVLVSLDRPVVEKELGEIVATYGEENTPIANDDVLEGIKAGTKFTFSAENAESIVVKNSAETIIAQGTDAATWIATETEGEELTVTASLTGKDSKVLTFMLEVVPDVKELGEIIVTYGDAASVVGADDEISVEVGTKFTFAAENATNIKVETLSETIVNFNGDVAIYTFSEPFEQDGIIVTATDGTNNNKTFEFYLTVTAPYVEPVNPNAEYVYKLVTNKEDIAAGGEYVICASATDRAMAAQNANNRKSEEVTIENNEIWTLPEAVQIVKLSNSNAVEGSFDMQVGETEDGTPQYLYAAGSSTASKNQNYLKTTISVGESSAAAISIDANNIVKIDFSKATGKQGRFMQYNGTGTSTNFACYTSVHTEDGYEHMRLFKKTELPGVPEYDEYVDDDTKVAIKIIKGQLHVVVSEFDAEGNEVTEEVVSAASAKAASYVSEPTWTNPVVTDENGMYLISLPQTSGNYITIKAKNELNGYHSEELVKYVDAAGNILSGVDAVMAEDADAPVEYFNMQGVRVEAGQPGIYVRRQGGKVAKVVVR